MPEPAKDNGSFYREFGSAPNPAAGDRNRHPKGGVHRFSVPGNNGVIGPLGESSHECRGYGLAILEESRKKAAPEKERLLFWLNQTPTADEANHNAMRDLRARLVPRLYVSGRWRLIQGNSHRIQRIPACAKSNGVTAFLTNAVLSPAIFLAIEDPEIKQAHGSLPGILTMNPPGDSKDEIDPAVMRRVADGDSAAFERVYDAFSGILYSLALRIVERPEDTEELLQEVFLKIWRDADDYDPRRGAPLAWAITITRHKAIDRIRSTVRRARLYEAAEAEARNDLVPTPQPVNDAEHSENAKAVRESLGHLAPEVRESIELAFFGGLSHSQIAARLSLPLTTVKSRIRRAMMQLRQSLRHYV